MLDAKPGKIIKKYPNRRLYDTELSTYITLDDLKSYILEYIPFKIIDAKTEQDVTCPSLIQIILEQEATTAAPIFSQEVLEHIVRFYGNPLQMLFQNYLKNSLNLFVDQKQKMQDAVKDSMKLGSSQDFLIDQWTRWWGDLQSKSQKK